MTDLPQLQSNLVDAAIRQRRRCRVRRVTVRVAVAATLLVAFPLLAREIAAPDPEVTAPTPTPTATAGPPKTVEEAYGVFRRVPRSTKQQIAENNGVRVFLVRRDGDLCLSTKGRSGSTMGCGPARTYLSGHKALMDFGRPLLAAAFPDGVDEAVVTYPGKNPRIFTIKDNGLAASLDGKSVRVEWVAPDGTPRAETLYGATRPEAQWGRFWDAERPADHLDDMPGARRIVSDPKVDAWLVPRRDAVCLLVRAGDFQRSACRRDLTQTTYPIVVSVEHRVVAAFPDRLRPLSVEPPSRHTIQSNALLIRDGDLAVQFTYRVDGGEREVRLPEQKDFVLNADPMSPLDLMPE